MEAPFLDVVLPFIPPTTNHAYVDTPAVIVKGKVVRHASRHLSQEGEQFKNAAKHWLAQNALPYLKDISKEKSYWIRFILYTQVTNKGYPKTAKARFKQLDGSNRIKLLEDTLAEIAGIDDSNFMDVSISKRHSDKNAMGIQMGIVPDVVWNMGPVQLSIQDT